MAAPKDATCWICLDGGCPRLPLKRGCGCRGDAGWAHVHCLASFASRKTSAMSLDEYAEVLEHRVEGRGGIGTNWSNCFTCKQPFVGDLQLDMASEWVKSVSSLDDGDAEKLMAKLNLGCSKVTAHGKNERKRLEEGFKICETVRAEAQRNVTKFLDSSSFIYHFDQTCLVVLSIISGSLGYKKKAAEFSKELKERDDKAGRADSGDFLQMMSDPTKRGSKELYSIFMGVYDQSVKSAGKDSASALQAAECLGDWFVESRQHAEAIKWMTETYTRSKRVYGSRHPDTMRSRKKFLMLSGFVDLPRRATLANAGAGGVKQEVTILKPTKGGKYIASIGSGRKVKVTPRQIILEVDTPVVHPEGFTCFVDGLDSRKDCYKVLAFSGIDEHDEEVFLDVPRDVRVFFAPC